MKNKEDIYELLNLLNQDEVFKEREIMFNFKFYSYTRKTSYITVIAIIIHIQNEELKYPLHQWLYETGNTSSIIIEFDHHCNVAYKELMRNIMFSIRSEDNSNYITFRDLIEKPIEELLKIIKNERG